jgi:hypothetical protein
LTRQDGHVLLNAVSACLRLGGGKGAACRKSRLWSRASMKTRFQMKRQLRQTVAGAFIWNPCPIAKAHTNMIKYRCYAKWYNTF